MIINVVLGFLSSLFILTSSIYSYFRFVRKAKEDFEDKGHIEEKDGDKALLKNKVITTKAFFSIFRIFSYTFLVVSFLYLNKNSLLSVSDFLVGITVGVICVLIGTIALKYRVYK